MRDDEALWLVGVGRTQARFAGVVAGVHTAAAALRIGRDPSCSLQLADRELSSQVAPTLSLVQ